jgi:site-specific recombinase XerD
MTNENVSLQDTQTPALLLSPIARPNPASVYLSRLGPRSRRTQLQALNTIARLLTGGRQDAESLDWASLSYAHTAAVRAELAGRYQANTANRMLSALKATLEESWRLGLMDAETSRRARDLRPIRGEALLRGRALSAEELRALFLACAADATPAGRRDAALLAVLFAGGLRRAELAALDLSDYDDSTGAITVRSGKGNKARIVYALGGAGGAIAAWLSARGTVPGALFVGIHWSGSIRAERLTGDGVYTIVRRRARQAGIRRLSPHDLRRTAITAMLEAGGDLSTVQRLAGHASVVTTTKYDRRGEAAKRKAADLLHVPF